ncbi:MAG: ureidoglycolate lyase [Myxococcales bacterium]|nr:ureidoglycolate lyase [Myxococcota bacterium]MDW8283655.1 ureidoglycolate lyase [Myxococcales bacterium]
MGQAIRARPLGIAEYAPYGDVIVAGRADAPTRLVNQGTARRTDHLAPVVNLRGQGAPLNVCVFRCAPWRDFPLALRLLERHPWSTQVFLPMGARRYLVVVALGNEAPDLGTLAAFVAQGNQGLSYRPGVWHHPIVALDAEADFASLVHEDGSAADCQEVHFAPGEEPLVQLPDEAG